MLCTYGEIEAKSMIQKRPKTNALNAINRTSLYLPRLQYSIEARDVTTSSGHKKTTPSFDCWSNTWLVKSNQGVITALITVLQTFLKQWKEQSISLYSRVAGKACAVFWFCKLPKNFDDRKRKPVAMYVCVYVCMYVCMYVCVFLFVFMFVCMFVCMYVCLFVCLFVCMYVCMYVCMCTHYVRWSLIRISPTREGGKRTSKSYIQLGIYFKNTGVFTSFM